MDICGDLEIIVKNWHYLAVFGFSGKTRTHMHSFITSQ